MSASFGQTIAPGVRIGGELAEVLRVTQRLKDATVVEQVGEVDVGVR
jgi:hypothetical protein